MDWFCVEVLQLVCWSLFVIWALLLGTPGLVFGVVGWAQFCFCVATAYLSLDSVCWYMLVLLFRVLLEAVRFLSGWFTVYQLTLQFLICCLSGVLVVVICVGFVVHGCYFLQEVVFCRLLLLLFWLLGCCLESRLLFVVFLGMILMSGTE